MECASKLNPNAESVEGLRSVEYMGAGYSKIYSLMLDGFPIYDSRVACALTSLICLFCEDVRTPQVPESLRLGVLAGRGKQSRNPSRGAYHFPTATKYQYTKSNLKAAWLLNELSSDANAGEFSSVPEGRRVRALEAALFMLGYAPLRTGAVVKN